MKLKKCTRERVKERKANRTHLPAVFTPKFLDDVDGRPHVIRTLRRRLVHLKRDTGCDSVQKELICQRAIFIAAKLETIEVEGVVSGKFDFPKYISGVLAMTNLLKALGLERKAKQIDSLAVYVQRKAVKDEIEKVKTKTKKKKLRKENNNV